MPHMSYDSQPMWSSCIVIVTMKWSSHIDWIPDWSMLLMYIRSPSMLIMYISSPYIYDLIVHTYLFSPAHLKPYLSIHLYVMSISAWHPHIWILFLFVHQLLDPPRKHIAPPSTTRQSDINVIMGRSNFACFLSPMIIFFTKITTIQTVVC